MAISILLFKSESGLPSDESRMLSSMGFSLHKASDIIDAKNRVKEKSIDILITEPVVNGRSGFELLHIVKRNNPALPIIMMSADGTVKTAVRAIQSGASDFLQLPVDADTLKAAIQKAVRDGNEFNHKQNADPACEHGKGKKLITCDEHFIKVIEIAKKIAPSQATILISGESGTGKEVLASFIHANCKRPVHDYVAMNCAALPEHLAESELFGHEKGAFTDAVNKRIGKFESAKNGTLVLDEISEMPLKLQAKLLRVLQEKEIDRIGGTKRIPVNTRIIAISNRDLSECVENGSFREDLYYRINVIPLNIPPLRKRPCDIPLLSEHFLKKYSKINSRTMENIDDRAMAALMKNRWKGNVRELENCMERAVLIGDGDTLLEEHLLMDPVEGTPKSGSGISAGHTVREMEKQLIFNTLKRVNDNRTHASKMLGISIRTLRNKLKEYKEEKDQAKNRVEQGI